MPDLYSYSSANFFLIFFTEDIVSCHKDFWRKKTKKVDENALAAEPSLHSKSVTIGDNVEYVHDLGRQGLGIFAPYINESRHDSRWKLILVSMKL